MDEKKEKQLEMCNCSKEKMCSDCAMEEYEREQYEIAFENFKLDLHKISNSNLE